MLANLALDGLEQRLRESFPLRGGDSERGRATRLYLIRYVDDFVIAGHSEELLQTTVRPPDYGLHVAPRLAIPFTHPTPSSLRLQWPPDFV